MVKVTLQFGLKWEVCKKGAKLLNKLRKNVTNREKCVIFSIDF